MKIGVFASSSNNLDNKYLESSESLLNHIFKRDNDLVFGAMNSGIMGIAYRIAKQNNLKVTGIAPEIYKDDFKQLNCDIEILTKDINSRTTAFINNSDILLFLPGGAGTLCELTTAIEMKRSKEFNKPIIIYNETGFYDELLQMLNKIYSKKFTDPEVRLSYNIANDSIAVMDLLGKYHSANVENTNKHSRD